MEILGYGEDALTLWAMTDKLSTIFDTLRDGSKASKCRIFLRPSFGRAGGPTSAQFGEFDFIILAERRLYLGESKWDKSSEGIQQGVLQLAEHQRLRHEVFKLYVHDWAFGSYASWGDFAHDATVRLHFSQVKKPVAPEGSLLASNLRTVLSAIKRHYATMPDIRDVLLYLHAGANADRVLVKASGDFTVVALDYSEVAFEGFIRIKL
jgi:hypothetical protein